MTRPHLFQPDSVFWRVNRESWLVLSGPRALLLELAHPLVAAGVAGHSDFRRDPFGRLFRTIRVMTDLNFGDAVAARFAAQRTGHCHRPVQGALPEAIGPYPAGTLYSAHDPQLKLWVLATLIDSVWAFHDYFLRPLSVAEKTAYYAHSHLLAHAFGIPAEVMPPTYTDFTRYTEGMINSDKLTVSPIAREVVAALFAPPVVGGLVRWGSFLSIGLTPPHIREAFGLEWGAPQERWLERWATYSRALRPLTPEALCVHPQALWAEGQPR